MNPVRTQGTSQSEDTPIPFYEIVAYLHTHVLSLRRKAMGPKCLWMGLKVSVLPSRLIDRLWYRFGH